MYILLPEPIQADKNDPNVFIYALNLTTPNTIRIVKRDSVFSVALTQDFYKNFRKYYYISDHKTKEEAQAEIDKIVEAFHKHEQSYRIKPDVAIKSDSIMEEARGLEKVRGIFEE